MLAIAGDQGLHTLGRTLLVLQSMGTILLTTNNPCVEEESSQGDRHSALGEAVGSCGLGPCRVADKAVRHSHAYFNIRVLPMSHVCMA